MTTRQALLALFLLPLGAVAGWWAPRALSKFALEREIQKLAVSLDQATTSEDAAKIGLELLEKGTPSAVDAVRRYAAKSPMRCFDEPHGLLLITGDSTGWVQFAEHIPGSESGRTGGWGSTTTDARPIFFSEIRLLESVPECACFLLIPKEETHGRIVFTVFALRYENGHCVVETTTDADDELLAKWRSEGGIAHNVCRAP